MPDESELNAGERAIKHCMRAWNFAYKKHSAGPDAGADHRLIPQGRPSGSPVRLIQSGSEARAALKINNDRFWVGGSGPIS